MRKTNLRLYQELVVTFNANLLDKIDEKEELAKRLGSVPYLATVSHGLSHTQYWKKVDDALRASFGSGKNPGYKKIKHGKRNALSGL